MKIALKDVNGQVVGYKSGNPEALVRWVEEKLPEGLTAEITDPSEDTTFTRPVTINTVRQKRNKLLSCYQWTVGPDSPLTKQNQAAWLHYLKALHRVTKDLGDPLGVVWPVEPELIYERS